MTRSGRGVVWGGIIALLLAFAVLIVRIAPWWHAGVTPVELVLNAPTDSEIWLHWSEGKPPLRMVPVGDEVNGWCWFWGTELPPRPAYSLAVEIRPLEETLPFSELRIWRLSPRKSLLEGISAVEEPEEWSVEGIQVIGRGTDRVELDASEGGTIRFTGTIDRRPENYLATLWLPLANLLVLGLLGVGLFGSGWRFPESLVVRGGGWSRYQAIGGIAVFLFAAGIHWHLATTSVPGYWPADSTSYADKGLALAYGQTFDTGGYEYELNRTPGYPLLIAFTLRFVEPTLNAVVQVQTAVALVCFGVFFWQLRRFLRSWLLLVTMPLVLWSPPLVWASRQIATESLFVSCWVIATGCAIQFWMEPRAKHRWIAWTVFIGAVTLGTLARANGILLLVLPGCALIGMAVRAYHARPGLLRAAAPPWSKVAGLLAPFIVVVIVLAAWSWRNAVSRGYARPSDLAPIVAANAPFNAGMLDVRAFENEEEYAWLLRARRDQGYFFPGWSLRNHRFREITNQWKELDDTTIGKLADSLKSFVKRNNELIPWEARIVAWWRVLGWGLWVPKYGAFTQDSLQSGYQVRVEHETEWLAKTVQQRFDWLSRDRGNGVAYPRLSVKEGTPSFIKALYNQLVPAYPIVYRLLVVAGVAALVWSVHRRHFVPVVLLAPFFVNLLLNVYFLYVIGRYLQVLDAMLLLGVATAFLAPSRSPDPSPP